MRNIIFGFLAFDMLVFLAINNFGPFNVTVGSADVYIGFPWQKPKPVVLPPVAQAKPSELPAINLPVVESPPQDGEEQVSQQHTKQQVTANARDDLPPELQGIPPQNLSIPANLKFRPQQVQQRVGSAYKCEDAKTHKVTFSDQPCEAMQMVQTGEVDGSKMNRAVATRVPVQQVQANERQTQGSLSPDQTDSVTRARVDRCKFLRSMRDSAEAARDAERKAEYQYQLIKNDCGRYLS